MQKPQICFDDQSQITKLKLIKKTIQHGEMLKLSEASGVHVSVISSYLNHAGRIVLNKRRVDKIISGWKIIEENKIRRYH